MKVEAPRRAVTMDEVRAPGLRSTGSACATSGFALGVEDELGVMTQVAAPTGTAISGPGAAASTPPSKTSNPATPTW
jgi:hypothetical protein